MPGVSLARILYVDDEEFWRTFIKNQLRDHHVDAVGSLQEAVDLLQSTQAYDVALVDLNLHDNGDGEGGELLKLLLLRYPETKRIAVTGSPPEGAVTRLITRYGIQELIIKGEFRLPDLRQAVEEAIAAKPDELPQALRLIRWTLRQRFRDWQRLQSDRIKEERSKAEEYLSHVTGIRGQTRKEAEEAVVRARLRDAQFREVTTRLRGIVTNINSDADFDAALAAQEDAEEQFSDDQGLGN
jgi:CheY-like chemotaxis protein